MVDTIYLKEHQLNLAYTYDTEAAFLKFNLTISNGIISINIYDKQDDIDFDIISGLGLHSFYGSSL